MRKPLICRAIRHTPGDEGSACYAEGRGFESLQPLREKRAFAGLFSLRQSPCSSASGRTDSGLAVGRSSAVPRKNGLFAGRFWFVRTEVLLRRRPTQLRGPHNGDLVSRESHGGHRRGCRFPSATRRSARTWAALLVVVRGGRLGRGHRCAWLHRKSGSPGDSGLGTAEPLQPDREVVSRVAPARARGALRRPPGRVRARPLIVRCRATT